MALIPGNLLSENNQSVETSVGGWASFSTVSSGVVQSGTQFFDGTKAVQSTANAGTAGALGGLVTTIDLPVVKAGLAYEWSYFVRPPVAAVFNANLDWYQSNNTTFVSSTNSSGQAAPANVWTKITLPGAVAPALAGVARLYLQVTSGLSNGSVVYFDQMFFGWPQAADLGLLFLPGNDPVALDPWGGTTDWQHDVVVNAGTASIAFLDPATRPFLLLALSSESGPGATVTTRDDPYVRLDPLLTPDDLTGGMAPWTGAPDSIAAVPSTTANAGAASFTFAALTATAGLTALPGTGSVTLTGRAPTAALGALPGVSAVTVAADTPSAALTALPGAAPVSLTGQSATAAPATTANAGVASVSFSALAPTAGISALPGQAALTITGQGPAVALTAGPGTAAFTLTGRTAAAGLGALPGTAAVTTAAPQDSAGLTALPGAAPVSLTGLSAATVSTEDQQALPLVLFLPDDLTGGMDPWPGAPQGILTGDTGVNAGVASITVVAQGASTGLSVGTGTAAVSLTGQQPVTGLTTGPGVASVSLAARTAVSGLSTLPGTGSVALTARTASTGLAAGAGAAPLSLTARNPSAAVSGTVTAGVAAVTLTAFSAAPGLGVRPGTATSALTALSPAAGTGVRPGTATIGLTAVDATVTVPQAAHGRVISGRETLTTATGREPMGSTSGREGTVRLTGREPVSSRSGETPDDEISGREG